MQPLLTELPYSADGAALFARIAHRPWAIWLDSAGSGADCGRYDLMVCDPVIKLTTRGELTEIMGPTREISRADPFDLVRDYLGRYQSCLPNIPFMGGAVGYFAYDLARRLEKLPSIAENAEHLPEMSVGIYDWALVLDHVEKKCWLVSHGRAPQTRAHWDDWVALFTQSEPVISEDFAVTGELCSNMTEAQYALAFDRIQHYIREGDCYQVNLAQRFMVSAQGDAFTAYRQLRKNSAAPFAAYLSLDQTQVLSVSPERFIQVRDRVVETRPIKGTRPRDADTHRDLANARELLESPKDRAENLMIVDLLRNDIGKNCIPGSVRAEKMFALESFSNVHHLVSTVTGQLAQGHDALHLLRGCFPGGSITGAPKLRAMEIIEQLEPNRRGIYCGAIGYIGFDGNMDTSIAIRTAVFSNHSMRFWAGGGIVADSDVTMEYRETLAKAANMLDLMRHFGAKAC